MRRELVKVVLGAWMVGCGPAAAGTDGTNSSAGSTDTTTSSSGTGTSTSGTGTSTSGTGTANTGEPTSGASGNFLMMPDLPAPGARCDAWQDTCPPGQKCKPFAGIPGPWEGASCVPVVEPATPTGEACVDGEWSITDACERGAVCHGFMSDGVERRCQELCTGSPMEKTCSDACATCFANGPVAGVCLMTCDPRMFGCPEGQRCEVLVEGPRFACTPGPGPSAAGESCGSSFDCTDGTVCVAAALVPNCAGERCCAPVCDTEGPDTCATALAGMVCGAWPVSGPDFEPACLPAGLGLCAAG